MDVRLTPEQERLLAERAAREGRAMDELVRDAVGQYLEEDTRFTEAVMAGLASLDKGEYVLQEELESRINRLLES